MMRGIAAWRTLAGCADEAIYHAICRRSIKAGETNRAGAWAPAIIVAIGAIWPANILQAERPWLAGGLGPRPAVHATELPSTSVDNQTSWIIEPDVPRIPKITGLDPKLPPHIQQRLSHAFDLAQRGAVYTANAEFRAVIGLCALESDSRTGGTSHRDAFREGFVALEEADDFGGEQIDWRESSDVRRVGAGHETPVLKGVSKPIEAIEAVQQYYTYAQTRLASAGQEMPGASLAFYGLARTFVDPGMHTTHAAAKAALLQRVAIGIAPQNVLARNELGVLLAEHGELAESAQLFRQCIATSPTPETWRNLSIVYARLGDGPNSQAALAASQAASARASDINANDAAANLAADQGAKNATDTTEAVRKPNVFERIGSMPSLHNPFKR